MSNADLFDPASLAPPHRTPRARLRELLTVAVVVTAGVEAYAAEGEAQPPSIVVSKLAAKALQALSAGAAATPDLLKDLLPALDAVKGSPPWAQDRVWADLRAFR